MFRYSAALFFFLSFVPSVGQPAVIVAVEGPSGVVSAGSRVEFQVLLDRSYPDPFDPAVVAMDAEVTDASGVTTRIPGFWAQDFMAHMEGASEVLTPVGNPSFRVRFRPAAPGQYTLVVRVKDGDGETASAPVVFEAAAPAAGFLGYVRRDPADPFALVRSTGQRYLPFGFNVCWSGKGGTTEFERWFQALADNGLNWSRVWMTHFNGTALEWSAGGDGGAYCGLGCYNLKAGWRLDRILQIAEQRGIAVQFVLQQHSQFETGKWSSWDTNPWNVKNGGPLERSADFFTRPDVIAGFDRKVRYIVARWADSPAILAWELFNEVELIAGIDMAAAHAWMRERAKLLQAIDPYGHLVTTSYAMPGTAGTDQDWGFAGYGLTQAHSYFPFYWETIDATAAFLRGFGKPAILAEFGVDYLGEQNVQDAVGAHLHNATLLAGLDGFTGGAMSWWWDGYVELLDLWPVVGRAADGLRRAGIEGFVSVLDGATTTGDDAVAIRAATTKTGAIAWLHDTGSEWDTGATFLAPTRTGVAAELPIACEGGTAAFFATWTGLTEGMAPVGQTPDGKTRIDAPDFVRDLLIRVDCPPPPAEPVPEPLPELRPEPEPEVQTGPENVSFPSPDAVTESVEFAPRARRGGCSARI